MAQHDKNLTVIPMEMREFGSFNDLEAAGIDWNNVLSHSLDDNPFLTYEWLSEWWRSFGKGRKLQLLAVKEEDRVLLMIPLMISTYKAFGVKFRKLEFVATPASDYHNFVMTDFEKNAEVTELLRKKLRQNLGVNSMELTEIPEHSWTAKFLGDLNMDGNWKTTTRSLNLCPYINLPESMDKLLGNLGSNFRRNLKRWQKSAEKDYTIRFLKCNEIGSVEEGMKIFFELHQKRWASKDKPGLFSNNQFRDFHMAVAKTFAQKGWLSLFFLTFNGTPVSAIYGYEYNQKMYNYLTGFDPKYEAQRPGSLIFKNAIEYSISKGVTEFDFMRGGESYKTSWGTIARRNLEFRFLKKGFKSNVYSWITNSPRLMNLSKKIGGKMELDSR